MGGSAAYFLRSAEFDAARYCWPLGSVPERGGKYAIPVPVAVPVFTLWCELVDCCEPMRVMVCAGALLPCCKDVDDAADGNCAGNVPT